MKNEKKIWKAIEGIQHEYERELLLNYKVVLDKIRLSMGRIYEKYAEKGKLTYAQMTKFNRLNKLEKEISGIMGPMFSKNSRLIDKLSKVQYEETFFRYSWAIEQEATVNLNWGALNAKTIEEAVKNDLALIAKKGIRQDGLLGIRRTIIQGLIRGDSYPKMARKIKKFIDRSASGYMRIARTEGQRAAVLGQITQADKSEELGIEISRIWDATLDDSTRPGHAAMDGKKAGKDGMFDTPVGAVAGPLQSGDPAFDINCFPGNALIVPGAKTEIAYRRWYKDKLYTISTDIGVKFAVTVNHPVLTDDGWIAAQFLEKGDNIICDSLAKPSSFSDIDIKRKPSQIDQIFKTLSLSGIRKRMPGITSQFHGDGGNGNVDIIFSNRLLWDRAKASIFEPINQLQFTDSNKATSGISSFNKRSHRMFATEDSSMGSSRESHSSFGGSISHSGKHGLATIPGRNSGVDKNTADDLPTDTISIGKLFNGYTGKMQLGKIISVDISDFSGHVYNLQTSNGIILTNMNHSVNGIMAITHNCRCRIREEIEEYKPDIRRIRGKGFVEYVNYADWKKAA